jgi:hypothetical protein
MAKANNDNTNNVIRTSEGLRDAIFDELDALRAGTSNPARANAVAKLAAGVVDTVRIEVEVQRLRVAQGKNVAPADEEPVSTLKLGKAA